MIDPALLTTTCDLFRPWNTGSPMATNVPCRLIPDLMCGRGSGLAGVLAWDHYMDLQPTVDVLDGVTRAAGTDGWLYADGDGVRTPSGASHPWFVVVWVEIRNQGSAEDFKRVYMIRHQA